MREVMKMNQVRIFENDTSQGLEKEINKFLNDPYVENSAIHYTVGSKPDKEFRNIQVPFYTAMVYYSYAGLNIILYVAQLGRHFL